MAVTTLKPVLKTVLVGSVKLTASADCIGSGTVMGIHRTPAYFLSPEYVFVLPVPVPEHWSRQEVADMPSMPPRAEAPESSPGTPSGVRACPRSLSATFDRNRSRGIWRTFPFSAIALPSVTATGSGRLRCLGSTRDFTRIDRDCQSLDAWCDRPQEYQPRGQYGSYPTATRTTTTPSATTAAK
ncbi:MAG: hypothetical protein LC104_03215 [Bacteroidales bacterium]|nr:hypothetical protein [Bacteroidales bacterium]